jgi:hypothetical protein
VSVSHALDRASNPEGGAKGKPFQCRIPHTPRPAAARARRRNPSQAGPTQARAIGAGIARSGIPAGAMEAITPLAKPAA